MKRLLIILMLMCASEAIAEEPQNTPQGERFDYIMRRNVWNTTLNAAGMRQDTVSQSYAEAFFKKENGALMDFSDSDNSWTAGAKTASIRHFKKVSFKGEFAYEYFDGKNMCGSMFLNPGYYPVDILEFTPGRKIKERYAFKGAVASVLGEHWTGGLGIDFLASNYAKRKDLRHDNKFLDFSVSPSILYHKGKWTLGGVYTYSKNSERVKASEIGTSAESYDVFFDKGLGYGLQERWDGNGTHLKEDGSGITGFPIQEAKHGFSTQVGYGGWFAELSYSSGKGKSGEKEVFWHEFSSDEVGGKVAYSFRTTKYEHSLRMNLRWSKQQNLQNSFTKEAINGVPTIIYFPAQPIFNRSTSYVGGVYEMNSSKWNMQAGIEWEKVARQSTLYYPEVREQEMSHVKVFFSSLLKLKNWDVKMGANFRKGSYSEQNYKLDIEEQTDGYPMQLTDYYNYATEYYTAPRMGLELGIRRHIHQFYVDASAYYEHGFNLDYVRQANRVVAQLSIGYNF